MAKQLEYVQSAEGDVLIPRFWGGGDCSGDDDDDRLDADERLFRLSGMLKIWKQHNSLL